MARTRRQECGVGEAAYVVTHRGSGGECLVRHATPEGVDRDREPEPGAERLDGGQHPVHLLGLGHLGPGTGLRTTHVQEVGPIGNMAFGKSEEVVEVPEATPVPKGIRGPIQDPHHECAGRAVVPVAGSQLDDHPADGTRGSTYAGARLTSSRPRSRSPGISEECRGEATPPLGGSGILGAEQLEEV